MNELSSVLRNTSVLVAARLLERANSFALAFFVSRILGPEGLGIYSAAIAYYGTLSIAAELGASDFLVREIAKHPSSANRYTVHVIYLTAGASVIAIAAVSWAIPFFGYSHDLQLAIIVAILAIVPAAINAIQEALFVAYQRVEFQAYIALGMTLTQCGISIYLLTQGYGVVSLLIAFVTVKYVMTSCAFLFAGRLIRFDWRLDLRFVRNIVRDLKSFSVLSFFSAVCARPELIIISLLANEAVVGLYSAAIKLVEFWYLVPQAFMTNVFPVLSRSYAGAAESTRCWIQNTSIKYLMALSLPLAMGITLAAVPILEFFYGSSFTAAAPILQWASWTLPLACLMEVLWRILAARNEQQTLLRVQIVSTFFRIAAAYGLTMALSGTGAALAALVSLAVHNVLLLNRIRRDGTSIHPYRLAWRFGLGAMVMGVVMMLTVNHIDIWIVLVIAGATYAVLGIFTRAISGDDLMLVRQMLVSNRKP
jgi:O-antigen/teichoic acid export membrane protein